MLETHRPLEPHVLTELVGSTGGQEIRHEIAQHPGEEQADDAYQHRRKDMGEDTEDLIDHRLKRAEQTLQFPSRCLLWPPMQPSAVNALPVAGLGR